MYHYRYSCYEEPEYIKKANENVVKYMEWWNRIIFGGGSSKQRDKEKSNNTFQDYLTRRAEKRSRWTVSEGR